MPYFVSHNSALEFWRLTAAGERIRPDVVRARFAPAAPSGDDWANVVGCCESIGLSLPIHVSVSDSCDLRRSKTAAPHLLSTRMPAKSFCRIRPGLYVASPELTLVNMATRFDNIDLIMLGYELCATFAVSSFSATGLIGIEPLTCRKRIEAFLGLLGACSGHARLRKLLPYILDNAASPPEAKIPMLLTLPGRWGGYSISAPELNAEVDIDPEKITTGASRYHVDGLWRLAMVALEYQSNAHHAPDWKRREDEKRVNDLTDAGYTVLQANNDHLQDPAVFRKFALQVARATKPRVHEERFELTEVRRELHHRLKTTTFWNR